MHPLFGKAFEYLTQNDFMKIENGTYEIVGKDLLAIVNSYDTEPREARFWESHKKYIDIQLIVSGSEIMGIAPLHDSTIIQEYNEENDFMKLEAKGEQIVVPSNYFTIFYPTDVHMPNLIHEKVQHVKKVVMKVRIAEPQLRLTMASNNAHKLEEISQKLAYSGIEILGLKESGITAELPETGDTLEYNAWEKANEVYSMFGKNCISDDTGLEVDALGGQPGVYSARYAGENASYEDNVTKLLTEMNGKQNRKAKFRTVICLLLDGIENRFEGIIHGQIAEKPSGKGGFGYDSVFIPDGYDKTFAEMTTDEKNKISHRAIAVEKLVRFLKDNF